MRNQPERILIVAAHPDDEVLGVGATVKRLSSQGAHVRSVFLATGITGGLDRSGERSGKEAIEKLRADTNKASKTLGIEKEYFLDFPDNKLDTVARGDLAKAIYSIQSDFRADWVFTHHFGDYNWDHGRVFDACLMACRANPGESYPKSLFTFEVPSSTERAYQTPGSAFCPTVYFDVTATWKDKITAMEHYASEKRAYPHPRSPQALEAWMRKRGTEAGLEFAECFALVRSICV